MTVALLVGFLVLPVAGSVVAQKHRRLGEGLIVSAIAPDGRNAHCVAAPWIGPVTVGDVLAFDYDAWLEDHQLPSDDEDFEWCCHIIVLAESAQAARAWGDVLVKGLASCSRDVFLRSSAAPHLCGLATVAGTRHPCPNYPALSRPGNERLAMPVVAYGRPASADFIGW